jgi:hypothetical protein
MNQLSTSSTSTAALPESWIEKMFHKMLLEYGKKFTDQWGGADTDELIAHWARELAGYTGPEMKRGLAGLDNREWPPTLPEFKKMCRPPVNEMTGYYEAIAGLEQRGKGEFGVWTHPAIYWAANFLRVDLMSQTYAQVKDRWNAILKSQMERGEWADIPPARVLLPTPDVSPAAKENATKMLAELGAQGITKKVTDRTDHKRWAKLILQRLADGDKTLSMLQIQFAKTAMDLKEIPA